MGRNTEDEYQHCRGEGCDIPMSEVTVDSQGRRVHHDHFFPTGIPTSWEPPPAADIEEVAEDIVVVTIEPVSEVNDQS